MNDFQASPHIARPFRKWYLLSLLLSVMPAALFFGMGYLLAALQCPTDMGARPLEDSFRCDIYATVMPLHWGMTHIFFFTLALGLLMLPVVMAFHFISAIKAHRNRSSLLLGCGIMMVILLIGFLVYQQSQFTL